MLKITKTSSPNSKVCIYIYSQVIVKSNHISNLLLLGKNITISNLPKPTVIMTWSKEGFQVDESGNCEESIRNGIEKTKRNIDKIIRQVHLYFYKPQIHKLKYPFRLRMNLVNEIIRQVDPAPSRNRRKSHPKNPWNESFAGIKEALQKADDLDNYKMSLPRAKRDTISAKSKVRDILDDLKEAKKALNKEYKWKYYNATELWPATNVSRIIWDLDNQTTPYLNTKEENMDHNCNMEIGITAACAGLIIAIIFILMKFKK